MFQNSFLRRVVKIVHLGRDKGVSNVDVFHETDVAAFQPFLLTLPLTH